MKHFILFLFIPFSSFAIELILDGKTYDISEYKIENNGQRIIINHGNIPHSKMNSHCNPTPAVKRQINSAPGPFQRLMNELDSNPQTDKKRKQRFQ